MRRAVLTTLVVAAGLGAAASVAGDAAAHQYTAPSSTTIRYVENEGEFRGRVTSPRAACERNRKIKLVRESEEGRVVVGRDRSNRRGRWRIDQPNPNGVYRAIVVSRSNVVPGHVHRCERGTSPSITIEP